MFSFDLGALCLLFKDLNPQNNINASLQTIDESVIPNFFVSYRSHDKFVESVQKILRMAEI